MDVNLDVGILKKLNFRVNKCSFDNFVSCLEGFQHYMQMKIFKINKIKETEFVSVHIGKENKEAVLKKYKTCGKFI